ncbi:hypothetical protein [Nocardia arthritidis]|uniref:Uncharacterized protein n=1 Tax=Nocardia arthritidis TaxID=228602 RepID=A0A6G9YA05_9NOCA|nr:hypothetical protein [Nocardia arthritidis]QIS10059.1 hypothetical protein F5544_10820 [Nocardia arthritidis]
MRMTRWLALLESAAVAWCSPAWIPYPISTDPAETPFGDPRRRVRIDPVLEVSIDGIWVRHDR